MWGQDCFMRMANFLFAGSLNNANNPARVLANKNFFTCTTNSGNPERARKAHLAHLGSKWEHTIHFISPVSAVPNNVRKKLEFQHKSSFTFFNKFYLVGRWLALALALQASENETLLMPSWKSYLFSMFWMTRLHSFRALLIVINCQCMIICRFIVLSIRCGHDSCLIWQ